VRKIVKSAIELLAGIPSVVYGLLGILIICFGCVKLFANFCESLINPKEK